MVQRTVLNNGTRVLTEKVPGCHSVSLGIWVRNGSRHESPGLGGISHFVEHMLFKGTERRSAQAISYEIDAVGGVLNGFTSREFSCYYVKVLDSQLPMALDLLGDLVCHSLFDIDEIEKERRVILQEIAMVEDSPEEHVHDLFVSSFWQDHPLGRPVIGDRETVGEINREELVDFLNQRYYGQNLVVVAAGNLEHDSLAALVDETLGGVAASGIPPAQKKPQIGPGLHVEERDLEQTHVCLGVEALPQGHPERYTAYLLNTLLGGNMSSRLFQTVREELGLAYSVYSYLNNHSDSGVLTLYAGTSGEEAPLAVRTMLHEMNRLRQSPVDAAELQAAKDYLKGSLLLSMESTDNRMTRLAKNELYLGDDVSLAESQAAIDSVSIDDIQALAGRLFQDRTLNLQVVGRVSAADFPPIDLSLG